MASFDILPTLTYAEVTTRLGGGEPAIPVFVHTGDGATEIITCYVPMWLPDTLLARLDLQMRDAWPQISRHIVRVTQVPHACLDPNLRALAPSGEGDIHV